MKHRLRKLAVLPIVALFAAACSTGSDIEPTPIPEAEPIAVQIVNNVSPGSMVTAEAVHLRINERDPLGMVDPQESGRFVYDPKGLRTDEFRLMAVTADGREYESRTFSLDDVRLIAWDLATNQVRLETDN